MASDDDTAGQTLGEERGSEGAREGAPGSGTGRTTTGNDPDMGADMSDTGGAQWDSVIAAGGIEHEPGLEGLGQGVSDTRS
jgi:hypothetical protein